MPGPPRNPRGFQPLTSSRNALTEFKRYGNTMVGAFDQASRMGSQGMLNAIQGYDEGGRPLSGLLPIQRAPLGPGPGAGPGSEATPEPLFELGGGVVPFFPELTTERHGFNLASSRALELVNTMPVPGGAGVLGAGPALFSNAAEAVGKAKFKKGMPQQYFALPGMKKEELEATGLADWLASHRGKSIDRDEVLEYLSQNEVRVGEVMKGEKAAGDDYSLWQNGEEVETGLSFEEAQTAVRQELEAGSDLEMRSQTAGLPTKFSQWQLPGGENYRELLITLPGRDAGEQFSRRFQEIREAHGVPDGPHLTAVITPAESAELERLAKAADQATASTFTGGHFDEPNVLAHIRMNDRVDAKGRKVLFIEEIQSDWHQKGRKSGYDTTGVEYEAGYGRGDDWVPIGRAATREEAQQLSDEWFRQAGYRPETAGLRERVVEKSTGVPDAPFKKTWHELGLKRAIRYAAENDYDSVAWTTGAQQADRYDLSKQIDTVDVIKHVDGGRFVDVRKDAQSIIDLRYDDKGIITGGRDQFIGKPLSDVLGKELADKVLAVPQSAIDGGGLRSGVNRFEGLDLQVGGEGMKAFYDRMLPQAATRIGKKYGAVAGKVDVGTDFRVVDDSGELAGGLATRQEAEDLATSFRRIGGSPVRIESGETSFHSITITDRLRDQAVNRGLPMFSTVPPGAMIPSDADTGAPEIFRLTPEQSQAVRRGDLA